MDIDFKWISNGCNYAGVAADLQIQAAINNEFENWLIVAASLPPRVPLYVAIPLLIGLKSFSSAKTFSLNFWHVNSNLHANLQRSDCKMYDREK